MFMKIFKIIVVVLLASSCVPRSKQLPENVFNMLPVENITLNISDSKFNLDNRKKANPINDELKHNISEVDLSIFSEKLDSLLLTGESRYADEIDKLIKYKPLCLEIYKGMIQKSMYTKMYDRLYVNLFFESEVKFEHTTGGQIKLKQNVNYPASNNIELEFENEEKRFIELYIRIPQNIKSARVEAGGVKYKAFPGEYCRIAKKWKTGNKVEVYFEK